MSKSGGSFHASEFSGINRRTSASKKYKAAKGPSLAASHKLLDHGKARKMRFAAICLMLLGLSLFALGCPQADQSGPPEPPAVDGVEETEPTAPVGEAEEAEEAEETEESSEEAEGSSE